MPCMIIFERKAPDLIYKHNDHHHCGHLAFKPKSQMQKQYYYYNILCGNVIHIVTYLLDICTMCLAHSVVNM